MLVDLRSFYTETGILAMLLIVSGGAWELARHGFERALHLTLAIGLGKGLALAALALIVLAQMGSCATLVLSPLYNRSGSIVPSAILAAALWLEALVFGDLSDIAAQARCSCLTASACLLAIFRYDRHARNARDQIPTSGVLLAIEATTRNLCTQLKTGIVMPPMALFFLVWALGWNAFWCETGVMREYKKGWWVAALSASALCLLLSGQDTKAHIVLGDHVEKMYDWWAKRKERLLGESARRGEKKSYKHL